jgi:hypothetical protein
MQSRSSRRAGLASTVLGAVLVASAVGPVHAQRHVFEWRGRVDHDVDITLRGNSFLATRPESDERVPQGSAVLTALPSQSGELTIKLVEGRGAVEVVQNPTSETGYTAVIRIHDTGVGADAYRIDLYWQAVAGGEVAMPGELVSRPSRPAVGPPPLLSNRTALIWTGDVDSELEIIIRPGGITYNTVRGEPPRALQSALSQMPWPAAMLDMNQIEGRGEASVIQQPTPENGFTAKIRVRDPQPGFGHYAFMAIWR